MKTRMLVVLVLVVLFVFVSTASANFLVDGSTHTGSATYPNFYVSWGCQRYAGDGDDFAHAWFDIHTPFQINNASWSYTAPALPDRMYWDATLLVYGIEVPAPAAEWASSNTLTYGDVTVFEGVLDQYSYGWSSFSASMDIWSPTAEITELPSFALTEYLEPSAKETRFTAKLEFWGDFSAAPVPEPSAILMLASVAGSAIGGLVWRRMRR